MANHPHRTTRLDDAIQTARAIWLDRDAGVSVSPDDRLHNAALLARTEAALKVLEMAGHRYQGSLASPAWRRFDAEREKLRRHIQWMLTEIGKVEDRYAQR